MNPRSSLSAGALALIAAFPFTPSVAAQDDAIVVTATRQAARANELLSDVAVITREDIEKARPQQTLGELLSQEGGIEFSSLGGPGATSNIYIRGANAGHTLLLIDGMRVGSVTLGAASIAAIPLAQIERVEVLKGSASSLYGSDAIGGVVQVFTRRGSGEPTFSVEAATGSHRTHEANAAVSGQADALHYSLRVGAANSRGFSAIGDRSNGQFNPDNDGYASRNVSANVSVDLAKGHELGVQAFHSRLRNEYDGVYYDASFNPRVDYNFRSTAVVESYAAYSRNRVTPAWTSLVRIGRSTDDSQDHSSPTERDDFRTHQDQVVWQNDIRIPLGSLLLAGESLRQSIDTSGAFAKTQRTINSLIAGWTANFGDHRLQLNARDDRNSQFGDKTTGAVAYGYQIDERWRARVALSTGFKAPSFNDLYFPDDPLYGGGNPDLKPETSRNREAGLHYDTAASSASLTMYRNIVDNLIQWRPDDPSDPWNFSWHPDNVGKAKLQGVTLTGRHVLGDVTLRASFDVQDHTDATTGKQLILRARRHGSVGFDHRLGKLTWGAELFASGARYNDAENTQRLGGYTTLGLRADYRFDKELTFFARAGNIFDKQYELRKDYDTAGRTVFVGVRYQPK